MLFCGAHGLTRPILRDFACASVPSRIEHPIASSIQTAAGNVAEVESVLRKSSFDEEGYTFAVERHADLARALGITSFGVGAGFR